VWEGKIGGGAPNSVSPLSPDLVSPPRPLGKEMCGEREKYWTGEKLNRGSLCRHLGKRKNKGDRKKTGNQKICLLALTPIPQKVATPRTETKELSAQEENGVPPPVAKERSRTCFPKEKKKGVHVKRNNQKWGTQQKKGKSHPGCLMARYRGKFVAECAR